MAGCEQKGIGEGGGAAESRKPGNAAAVHYIDTPNYSAHRDATGFAFWLKIGPVSLLNKTTQTERDETEAPGRGREGGVWTARRESSLLPP